MEGIEWKFGDCFYKEKAQRLNGIITFKVSNNLVMVDWFELINNTQVDGEKTKILFAWLSIR